MEREQEEKGAPPEWCKIHEASEIVERWDLQSGSVICSPWNLGEVNYGSIRS